MIENTGSSVIGPGYLLLPEEKEVVILIKYSVIFSFNINCIFPEVINSCRGIQKRELACTVSIDPKVPRVQVIHINAHAFQVLVGELMNSCLSNAELEPLS